MKKKVLFVALLMGVAGALTAQNYQIPNGDFELWDGNSNTSEPVHWNSFASSDGTFAGMASTPHHYRRGGARPGSEGAYYLTIYTKSILGIKANGNMTTGRIHAGSMTASSSNNYNYTVRNNPDFCLPFTATPDSIYMWVSYYAANAASETSVKAIIHGDSDFQDPNHNDNASLYCGKAVVDFGRTTSSASEMGWTLLKVPFEYSGTADPAYMIISLTTNKTPGGGDANDSLSIDDIVLVYSAWLNDISLDGNTIEGFSKGVMDYDLGLVESFDAIVSGLGYQTEVADAAVERGVAYGRAGEDSLMVVTLTVTAEDGVTQRVYTVRASQHIESEEPPVDPPVGLDVMEANVLTVYPNPACSRVCVRSEEEVLCLELMEVSGRIVRVARGASELSLSGIPQGNYVLRIVTRNGVTARGVQVVR